LLRDPDAIGQHFLRDVEIGTQRLHPFSESMLYRANRSFGHRRKGRGLGYAAVTRCLLWQWDLGPSESSTYYRFMEPWALEDGEATGLQLVLRGPSHRVWTWLCRTSCELEVWFGATRGPDVRSATAPHR